MKSSYEAVLMSKQKLHEEMERLKNDYNKKGSKCRGAFWEFYSWDYRSPAGASERGVPTGSVVSVIALANELVS